MENNKKLLNEGEGEISLALIGLIMKKIKKVAFEVVYEKLLKDGDERASKFFKIEEAKNVTIQNYEDLLNLEKTDAPPETNIIEMQDEQKQINNLTSAGLGEAAFNKLAKLTKSNSKDNEAFKTLGNSFNAISGDEDKKKILKDLIYKYDPVKDSMSTHIFPYTQLEEFFIKKRTGLERAYTIKTISNRIKQAATIFYHLKKIRLMIMKVQEASRNLKGQKIKDDDKKIKTIGDIIGEVQQQTTDTDTDNLIKSFVMTKGKIGLNPFAIADELLYSVYGEDELKKFMKQAEDMHDILNEVSEYVVKVLKTRRQDDSGESDEEIEGVSDQSDVIAKAKQVYLNKIEKKYKYKDNEGNPQDVSKQITSVLDILAASIVSQFKPDKPQNNQEESG